MHGVAWQSLQACSCAMIPGVHASQHIEGKAWCWCCSRCLLSSLKNRVDFVAQTHLLASANFCHSCEAIASASFSTSTSALLGTSGHLHAALSAPLVLAVAGGGEGLGSTGVADGLG